MIKLLLCILALAISTKLPGEPVKCVTTSLKLVSDTVTLHEPAFIQFLARNDCSYQAHIDLGYDRLAAFKFTITTPSERVDRPQLEMSEGISRIGSVPIDPGETYKQTLVLNRWIEPTETGQYRVDAQVTLEILTPGERAQGDFAHSLTLQVLPRNPERLEKVANSLLEQAGSVRDKAQAMEAALALSYMDDPVAIPYLEKLLNRDSSLAGYASAGLERIATPDAVLILLGDVNSTNSEVRAAVLNSLYYVQKKTLDPELKRKIEAALRQ